MHRRPKIENQAEGAQTRNVYDSPALKLKKVKEKDLPNNAKNSSFAVHLVEPNLKSTSPNFCSLRNSFFFSLILNFSLMTICKHSMLNNRTKGPGLQNAGSLFTMFVFVFVFVFVCV